MIGFSIWNHIPGHANISEIIHPISDNAVHATRYILSGPLMLHKWLKGNEVEQSIKHVDSVSLLQDLGITIFNYFVGLFIIRSNFYSYSGFDSIYNAKTESIEESRSIRSRFLE